MIFRKEYGNANIATLVERKSRYTVLFRNNDRQSKPIMGRLINELSALPHLARQSITFDRGFEFVSWRELEAGMGTKAWFCDPQAPWQKGSVENTNGRARKWLSREVDPLSITDRHLTEICNRLNSTRANASATKHRRKSSGRNCSHRDGERVSFKSCKSRSG
jgi:IS30 family transposase